MEINERVLKFTASVNIPKDLDENKSYSFVFEDSEIKSVNFQDNKNGTWDKVYKFDNKGDVNIIYEQEVVRGAKKNGSPQQKLQYEIAKRWASEGSGDKEDYYKAEISRIIENYINER